MTKHLHTDSVTGVNYLFERYITRDGKGHPVVKLYNPDGQWIGQLSLNRETFPADTGDETFVMIELINALFKTIAPTPVAEDESTANGTFRAMTSDGITVDLPVGTALPDGWAKLAQSSAPVAKINPLISAEAARQALAMFDSATNAKGRKAAKQFAKRNGIQHAGGSTGDAGLRAAWEALAGLRASVPSAPKGESLSAADIAQLKALLNAL